MATNILNGKRFIDILPEDEVSSDARYCIALTGADGKLVPSSRLSEDFEGLNAAFAVLAAMQVQHQNAGVFSSSGLMA